MREQTAEQAKITEWALWLLAELGKRSGRKDIEVKVSPSSNHDVSLYVGGNGQPIVIFNSVMRDDAIRVEASLDYASDMIKDWALTTIRFNKDEKDCLTFFERIKAEFPHMTSSYSIVDGGKHSIWIAKKDDKIVASFDLWPLMTEHDVDRIAFYIKDLEATLHRENANSAGVTYTWQ